VPCDPCRQTLCLTTPLALSLIVACDSADRSAARDTASTSRGATPESSTQPRESRESSEAAGSIPRAVRAVCDSVTRGWANVPNVRVTTTDTLLRRTPPDTVAAPTRACQAIATMVSHLDSVAVARTYWASQRGRRYRNVVLTAQAPKSWFFSAGRRGARSSATLTSASLRIQQRLLVRTKSKSAAATRCGSLSQAIPSCATSRRALTLLDAETWAQSSDGCPGASRIDSDPLTLCMHA
jgi:hypothetical protein